MKRKLLFIMFYCPLQNEIPDFIKGYSYMSYFDANSGLSIQVPDIFNNGPLTILTNHNY